MFKAAKAAASVVANAASAASGLAAHAVDAASNAAINNTNKLVAMANQKLDTIPGATGGGKKPRKKVTLHDSDAPELDGKRKANKPRAKSARTKKPRAKKPRAKSPRKPKAK